MWDVGDYGGDYGVLAPVRSEVVQVMSGVARARVIILDLILMYRSRHIVMDNCVDLSMLLNCRVMSVLYTMYIPAFNVPVDQTRACITPCCAQIFRRIAAA